jgi:hypothetical protein
MSLNQYTLAPGVKLNDLGGIDIKYYRARANSMRSAHMAQLCKTAAEAVARLLHRAYDKYFCIRCHAKG